MADRLEVAVVGAGPFGLSVAAHLAHRRVRAFGRPMETWRTRMPADMRLRSDWDETNLSAPGDRGSIDAWARAAGEPREEPIPLQKFLRYADWFRETLVPDTDASNVVQLERGGGAFRVTTEAGDEADAGVVVVAVGVTPFAYAPPPFDQAMATASRSRSTARTTSPTAAAASSSSAAAREGSRRPRSRGAQEPRSRSSSARSCAGSPTASRTSRAGASVNATTGSPIRSWATGRRR